MLQENQPERQTLYACPHLWKAQKKLNMGTKCGLVVLGIGGSNRFWKQKIIGS